MKPTVTIAMLALLLTGCASLFSFPVPNGYDWSCRDAHDIKGDCLDKAEYASALLDTYDLPHRVVIGQEQAGDEVYHAWVEFEYNGETWVEDPSWPWLYQRVVLGEDRYIEDEFRTLLWADMKAGVIQ